MAAEEDEEEFEGEGLGFVGSTGVEDDSEAFDCGLLALPGDDTAWLLLSCEPPPPPPGWEAATAFSALRHLALLF